MDFNSYKNEMLSAFATNGLAELLTDDSIEKFYKFHNTLVEVNKQFNLTAITEEKEVIVKHFIDCASIASYIPAGATVIDVGCGAGFPTIPLAILRPDISIIALDSTQKRINFVERTSKSLDLQNVTAICGRAEDFVTTHRESFDICVSRAVARLNILSEICLPLVKVGGAFLAMKSLKGDEEYVEAKSGITKLGGELKQIQSDEFRYSEISMQRKLLVIQKKHPSPAEYPRKYSQILKKPL